MGHPDNISRELVPSIDVSPKVEGVVVKVVDVGSDFNNKQEFDDWESMFTWIRRNATNIGFGAVIGRLDNVLLLNSAYKINKYQLLLFEMVCVTSIEKTYAVGFALLECEKEGNFRTKQLETEGGKLVKSGVIVEQIMDEWTRIANSSTKELYADSDFQFRKVCENKGDLCRDWDTINFMIKNQHNEIQTTFGRSITVLEHRFRDNILYSQLIGNVSRAGLNYIFHGAKQGETVGSNSVKCGCTITRTLSFDDDGCVEGEKSNISITSELEAIKERFSKADGTMNIKEQLRKIGYPETTDMKPPSQPVKTKGAPKKLNPTPNEKSTKRSPSYCEHVDKFFPDSLTPKFQKSQKISNKGARISKPPLTPIPLKISIIEEVLIPPKIPFMEEMSVFMHSYIKRIVDVVGDGNYDYRAVSALLGNGEGNIRLSVINSSKS
ncbi:uncharacterized protein LOC131598363 [Vicia villosa]|uniref:uncharacterized protein LOC131598363 n=1 Tax=Vicia villosa TaxID=3911 RepID=UPI00273BE23F|nr:uncharacterized protein LOC131598363 [Vicia villosa]